MLSDAGCIGLSPALQPIPVHGQARLPAIQRATSRGWGSEVNLNGAVRASQIVIVQLEVRQCPLPGPSR